jgi:hypothetical protein
MWRSQPHQRGGHGEFERTDDSWKLTKVFIDSGNASFRAALPESTQWWRALRATTELE